MTTPSHRGRLFVIAAPSGTGKTSLLRALLARRPQVEFSVSYTTRPRRATEVDGRDYHFVSHDQFKALLAADGFIEHASVFDNFYGTGRDQVERALAEGRDLILEIDWQGAQQVRQRLPEAVHIFILPPSRATLESRLNKRSTDTPEVIARRLRDSVTELSHWHEFDYVIVNDDFDRALDDLEAVVTGQGDALRADRPGLADFANGLLA